jgi:hypothetical protein
MTDIDTPDEAQLKLIADGMELFVWCRAMSLRGLKK